MAIRITDIDGKKPSFVQWDVDRVLYIEGTDSQPCLHFANPMLTRAIVVEAEADGSRWSCQVPNIILQTAAPIVISVFIQPDEGKTVLTDWVKVQPKMKPQDYTYEENIGYTNWVVKSAEAQAILDDIEDLRQEIAEAAEAADDAATAAGEARDQAVVAADGIDESIATALAEAKASGEFDGRDGEPGAPGPKGDPGDDGISPNVSVTAITGGHRVTIEDADNTYVFDVMDGDNGDPGAKGDPGDDGFSPEVSVATITGGHRVTITDADGTNVFDVMDGEDGGIPAGGTTGQVLAKASGTDYDTEWVDQPGGGGLPTGGTAGQVLTLMEGFPIGSDPVPAWENPAVVVFDFTLDADSQVTSGPTWAEVDNVADSKIVFARATNSGGSILLMPLVDGEHYIFSAIDHLGAIHSIIPGQSYHSWEYTDNALGEDVAALWNEKLDNNFGSSEAGKFLVVGSDGAVTTKQQHEEVTVSTAGAVTQALDAGKIYHFTGALTALTITLNAAPSGQLAQYHFDFNCGSTAPTVTLPNAVVLPDSNSFDASKHYEVDILNNYGAVMAWPMS